MAAPPTRIFIGGLTGTPITSDSLRAAFSSCGPITNVEVKPQGYAFMEFGDVDGARTALERMNGANVDGCSIRVEAAQGRKAAGGPPAGGYGGPPRGFDRGYDRGGGYDRGYDRGGGYDRGYDRGGGYDRGAPPAYGRGGGGYDRGGGGYDRGYGRGPPPSYGRAPPPMRGGGGAARSPWRVIVEGLPPTVTWQTLKDLTRSFGDVNFTQTRADGSGGQEGLVEFAEEGAYRQALVELNGADVGGVEVRARPDQLAIEAERAAGRDGGPPPSGGGGYERGPPPSGGGGGYERGPPPSGGGGYERGPPPSGGGGGGYERGPPPSGGGGGYERGPPPSGGGGGGYERGPPPSGGGDYERAPPPGYGDAYDRRDDDRPAY